MCVVKHLFIHSNIHNSCILVLTVISLRGLLMLNISKHIPDVLNSWLTNILRFTENTTVKSVKNM